MIHLLIISDYLSCVARKTVLRDSDLVQHKPACTVTGIVLRVFCDAKTKALISCAVTAQLICAFVFSYAIIQFSHVVAHMGTLIDQRLILTFLENQQNQQNAK